jgi:nucleotide-binding universal stress UspA family protein
MSVQAVYSDHDAPGQVVTAYAEEHGFDILVLGRHGDGARRRSRLGRVADRAAQDCSAPVLLLSAR